MSFFDDHFIIEDGPFAKEEKVKISKEQMEKDAAEIKKLEEDTLTMDQRSVAMRIRELRDADHKGDQEKINALIKDFRSIDKCLGDESKILLELEKEKLESNKKESSSALSKAKIKNIEAKLGIIKYKSIIKEAAGRPMRNNINDRGSFNSNNKTNNEGRTFTKKVLVGSAVGLAAIVAIGCGARSCAKNGSFVREDATTTTINNTTTFMEETSTMEVTTSTGDYSVETVEGYDAPTRETTTEDTNTTGTDKNGKNNNDGTKSTKRIVSTKKLRETTPKNKKTVISKATNHSDKPNNQTSQIPTNKDGERTDGKKPTTKPTGNKGTLPIKPSKKTLSPEEKQAENVNKSERKVKTLSLRLW